MASFPRYLTVPQPKDWLFQYLPAEFVAHVRGNPLVELQDARLYQFGILSSAMHMIWIKYAYGNKPTFISFPWPIHYTEAQRKNIETLAQKVLEVRDKHIAMRIEDLYDPRLMPDELRHAHAELDAEVDGAYRAKPFTTNEERINFLLGLHDRIAALWETNPEEVIQMYAVPQSDMAEAGAM